jgi:hypothetical protein
MLQKRRNNTLYNERNIAHSGDGGSLNAHSGVSYPVLSFFVFQVWNYHRGGSINKEVSSA